MIECSARISQFVPMAVIHDKHQQAYVHYVHIFQHIIFKDIFLKTEFQLSLLMMMILLSNASDRQPLT